MNFKESLNRFFTQISALWKGLSNLQKITAGVVLLSVLIGLVFVFSVKNAKEYRYLFVDISPEDSQAIVSFLKSQSFSDFILDSQGIKVPTESLAEMRLKVAQEGLPSQGQVGWEKFDDKEFTRTEFEQNIHRLRAVQGELARTIRSIDGIVSARVHIVLPKQSIFAEDKKDPTAAIYLKPKRGFDLDKRQIKGIQHLVSRSVEGLSTKDVAIIDHTGKMLTEVEADDFASKMTKERLSYKKALETHLEERVREIVGRIVGPERVDAKVDASVDFTQEVQKISDVDPDDAAVVSKNTQGMSMEGTGLNPTGIPGSKSNVPGEDEPLNVSSSRAQNKRDTELINYEVSKTVSEKTLPIGNIIRLSVAVIVDGKQQYGADGARPEFVARSEEEMKKISDLVKTAVGYEEKRGDEVTVHNMMFQLDTSQMQVISEKKKENKEYISTLVISATIALSLILFFAFVVRPYFRWLSYDPDRKKAEAFVEEFKPDLDLGAIQDVHVKEEVPFDKLSPKEQVLYLAKHEPKRTTEALKLLLNPHSSH